MPKKTQNKQNEIVADIQAGGDSVKRKQISDENSEQQKTRNSKRLKRAETSFLAQLMANGEMHYTCVIRENLKNQNIFALDYVLGKIIGEGAHGKVRIAYQNGVKLACKTILKKKCSSIFLEEYLPREIAINLQVEHLNIAKLHSIRESGNAIMLFLEFCNLGDLAGLVFNDGVLPDDIAKNYFRQISEALEYLHNINIAHRDIKAENVLLASEHVVKLSDFGLSRMVNKEIFSNTFCGTYESSPPEVHLEIAHDPLASDLWSMGCLLYFMLTGRFPFYNKTLIKMVQQQIDGKILWPSNVEVSISAKTAIYRLLNPVPKGRGTAKDLVNLRWLKSDV